MEDEEKIKLEFTPSELHFLLKKLPRASYYFDKFGRGNIGSLRQSKIIVDVSLRISEAIEKYEKSRGKNRL